MRKQEVSIFWFRRDLRLEDNVALYHALQSKFPVIPLFIFDADILNSLPKNDARVGFIHESLNKINAELNAIGSSLLIKNGTTTEVWESLFQEFAISEVFFNNDYEPYAIKRDLVIKTLVKENNASCYSFKDQVIFEEKKSRKQMVCLILFILLTKISGWKNINPWHHLRVCYKNYFSIFTKVILIFPL